MADSDGNGLADLNVFYLDGFEIPTDVEAEITKNQYPTFTTSEVNLRIPAKADSDSD